jgi:acid-sensing ion channel, other
MSLTNVLSISEDFWSSQSFTLKFPRRHAMNLTIDDYPLKSSARQGNGLKLKFMAHPRLKRNLRCVPLSFLVHSPYEAPAGFEIEEMYQFLYGYDLEVLITPEVIQTDEDLKSIDPKIRGCFFEGERKLKFFKVYTRRNCEFECISDYLASLNDFNCTQFYMARGNEEKVCDHRQETKVRVKAASFMRPDKNFAIDETFKDCNCLDECNSIKYNTEVISHSYNAKTGPENFLFFNYFYYETEVEFKFKDVDVVPLRRYRHMTFSDFLAQSGGMMGLFAGISALSVIEMFYFLTLRWMTNLCRLIRTKIN